MRGSFTFGMDTRDELGGYTQRCNKIKKINIPKIFDKMMSK